MTTPPPIASSPVAKTSALALWSLILGILSWICLGPLTAVPAIICGHLALPRIRNAAGQLTGQGLAIAGLVLGYVGLVLGFLIAAALLFPAINKARDRAQETRCIINVRQLAIACENYALDHQTLPVSVAELNLPVRLVCAAAKNDPSEHYQIMLSGPLTNLSSHTILIQEKTGHHRHRHAVAYVDGTAEMVDD